MTYPRYAIFFLATAIGVGVLVSMLNASTDSTLGSSAQLMVPAMVAALIEGRHQARLHRARPAAALAWRFAWLATAVAVLLNVVLAYLAGPILPEFAKLAVAPVLSQQFGILLGLYAGGYLICNRLFFGIGAGNQLSLMRSRGEIE